MRRAARKDDNQTEIVKALEAIGCSVFDLSPVGNGMADLIAGYAGVNWLLECKDGNKAKSRRQLTPAQKEFRLLWRGQYAVVESAEDAVNVVTGKWK